jgi:multiple sugar transport system permease protein
MTVAAERLPLERSRVKRRGRRLTLRRLGNRALFWLGILFFVAFAIFPVLWMAITALKTNTDLYNLENVPFWFAEPPTLAHVRYLFEETLFSTWLVNSAVIALFVVLITLTAAIPAGYALARLRFPWSENLGILLFLTYLVPPSLLFLPLSRIVSEVGVQDSKWALVLVYPTFTIPFCTWLLHGYFKTVPREIEEAARVDGCGRFSAVWRVILPVSAPGVLSVVIFAATLSIQEFLYALTFVSAADEKPVPLGVATDLVRGDVFYWGSLMAGALIVGVPVAILYNFFLDHFVAGITGGATK